MEYLLRNFHYLKFVKILTVSISYINLFKYNLHEINANTNVQWSKGYL